MRKTKTDVATFLVRCEPSVLRDFDRVWRGLGAANRNEAIINGMKSAIDFARRAGVVDMSKTLEDQKQQLRKKLWP